MMKDKTKMMFTVGHTNIYISKVFKNIFTSVGIVLYKRLFTSVDIVSFKILFLI